MGGGMADLIMILCGTKDLLEGNVFIERPLAVGRCFLPRGLPLVGARLWLSRSDWLAGWQSMSTRVHDYVCVPSTETICMVKERLRDAPAPKRLKKQVLDGTMDVSLTVR
jgi:hypothetical protein